MSSIELLLVAGTNLTVATATSADATLSNERYLISFLAIAFVDFS